MDYKTRGDILKRINLIKVKLSPYNIEAISYFLEKEVVLTDLLDVAQKEYGCVTKEDILCFVVMVMKLSRCSSRQLEETLLKETEKDQTEKDLSLSYLHKADGLDLLHKCIKPDCSDDDDETETRVSIFRMRANLISLNDKLNKKGHDEKFLHYICMMSDLSVKRFKTNFELFKTLENMGLIEPNNLDIIRSALTSDDELRYALKHFESKEPKDIVLQKDILAAIQSSQPQLKKTFSRSESEKSGPPSYDQLLCVGSTSTTSVPADSKLSCERSSSFCHSPLPKASTSRRNTFPQTLNENNEAKALPHSTEAQSTFEGPQNSRLTQTDLSSSTTGNSVLTDVEYQ